LRATAECEAAVARVEAATAGEMRVLQESLQQRDASVAAEREEV